MFKELILLLSLIVHNSNAQLKKCCPIGETVQIRSFMDNDLSSHPIYRCVNSFSSDIINNSTDDYDEESLLEPKINTNSQEREFIAFNTLADNHSHWPSCRAAVLSKNKLNEPMKVSAGASCVDLLDNSYYVFTCDENIEMTRDRLDVYKLRKCCPYDMSYDIFTRMCVVNNSSDLNENFRDILFERVVLFEHDKIKCDEGDVLVEYHSNVHDLKMFEGSLVITNYEGYGPEVFNRKYYCIESTLNSEIEQPSAMTSQHFEKRASSKWIAKVCRNKEVCKEIPCVKKCCKLGERMVFTNSSSLCEEHEQGIDVQFYSFSMHQNQLTMDQMEPREYGILMPRYCEKFKLEPDELHYISGIDGSLYYDYEKKFYPNEEFCVDYFYDQSLDETEDNLVMTSFVCFDDEEQNRQTIKFHIYATLLAISALFLGITFLVYIFLPKLLNLHGKTVVCHVLSLFIGYAFLSGVQFSTTVKYENCVLIAFIIYFGLLSAFSWLNIMCLDIYWTFGSVRASQGIRRTKEMKRFVYYSLYAWGFPFLMTIFTSMMNIYDVLPEKFKPKIGVTKCWFEEQSSPGHLIFFLLPIGIQISINFILFILTAIHCNRIKAEIHRMQSCDNSDQQKKKIFVADKAIFMMNVKLFCVMGVSWFLEIVATVYKQNSLWWSISDTFNCLQGVLVFLIFVFKKKVLVAFRKKLGCYSAFDYTTWGFTQRV
ncbi:hypothetical protein ACKWTF_001819 [Chironomus riparius]